MEQYQEWLQENNQTFSEKEKEFRYSEEKQKTITAIQRLLHCFSPDVGNIEEKFSIMFHEIIHLKITSPRSLLVDLLRNFYVHDRSDRSRLESLSFEEKTSLYQDFEKKLHDFSLENLPLFLNQTVYTKKERLQSLFNGVYVDEETEQELKHILQTCLHSLFQFIFSQISHYDMILQFSKLFSHPSFKPKQNIRLRYEAIFKEISSQKQKNMLDMYRTYVKRNTMAPALKQQLLQIFEPDSYKFYQKNALSFFDFDFSFLQKLESELQIAIPYFQSEIERINQIPTISLEYEEERRLAKRYLHKFEMFLLLHEDIQNILQQNKNAS